MCMTIRRALATIALSLATIALTSGLVSAHDPDLFWVYETTGGYLDSSPAIADLDGDGSPDVVIASLAGPVFALDAFGREIWKVDLIERITIAPTAADVTGDPLPEVLVLTHSGRLYCLAGRTGDAIWVYDIPTGQRFDGSPPAPESYSALPESDTAPIKHAGTTVVAADLTGDGLVEIVTNTVDGTVVCLSGSGELLWSWDAGEDLPAAPAAGDVTGDGRAEIVLSSLMHPAICLSADGEVLWKYSADPGLAIVGRNSEITSPVIVDLTGDGRHEVVTYDQNVMVALDADGVPVWKTVAARRKVDASLTVADADRVGSPELYAVDLTGDVVRVNADGEHVWTRNIGGRARRGFSVADVDGDGNMEILVGAYTGKIHILTPDGEIKYELDAGAGTNATSSVVDLAGDGGLCVVTPEITGNLTVYRWERGDQRSEILVPGYRGGNTRTASPYVSQIERKRLLTRLDLGNLYERRAEFAVDVADLERERRTVTLTISDKSGVIAERQRTFKPGRTGSVQLRYDGTRLSGTVAYTCVIENEKGTVEEHTFSVPVQPFAAQLDAIHAQDSRLSTMIERVPDKTGIIERHAYLRTSLPGLRSDIAQLPGLSPMERRALWARMTGLSADMAALNTLATSAIEAGSVFTVSSANPWAPFGGVAELSEDRMGSPSLAVEAFGGEVESAALNVWNFSGAPRTLRITLSGLKNGETAIEAPVIIREVIEVGTQNALMRADALPTISESGTIVVPAWGARQVWFEIHTEGLAPGEWTGEVRLKDLALTSGEVTAPLTVTVWPVAQSREHVFHFCGWSDTRPPGVLEDMLSHGMNVFTDARAVPFEYDEQGAIVYADFSELDEYMATRAPHGTAMFHSLVRLSGPAESFDPIWKRAYIAAVRQFTAHVHAIGFGYGDFTYYPVDEPGLEDGRNVDRFMQWAPLTREADPNIRIYTNPVGLPIEWLERMDPYVDIYAPLHSGFWHQDPKMQEHVELMHSGDRELWTYHCSHNAKIICPLGYNRAQMWNCFNDGHTGGGLWTYYNRSESGWHVGTYDYNLVYSGPDGPIPSKRWEAVRDGTEDYSMLMALKSAAARPDADPALVTRARALIDGDILTVGDFYGLDEDGIFPGKDGDPGMRKIADRRWEKITSVRREMRELLEAFAQSSR